MGVAISDILISDPINITELQDKIVAIDAFNYLFQFLASLRGPDGALLTDSNGRVTSHLVGLFNRTTHLMQKGVKCVFVFDGEAPLLKQKERDRRRALKESAQKEYETAQAENDTEAMRKFAMRTTTLTEDMVADAKELITALGLPIVQAPSEGEAQAAYMVTKGDVDYVATQDADAFLFGAEKVVRNLSILGKRKKTSKLSYETIGPEVYSLSKILNNSGIDQERLIALSLLVGTDFNPGGVKGIGPKNALKIVKNALSLNEIFTIAKWDDHCETPWKEVYEVFTKIPTTDDYDLTFGIASTEKVKQVLCEGHDFSEIRVSATMKKIEKAQSALAQKGLDSFFG